MKIICDDDSIMELTEEQFYTLLNNLYAAKNVIDTVKVYDEETGQLKPILEFVPCVNSKYVC